MDDIVDLIEARFSKGLRGSFVVPGDKSISHRSLILGSMAIGETIAHGLLEAQDVLNTVSALNALGSQIKKVQSGIWSIRGVGVGGFMEPDDVINCGNSGTSVRLLMGVVSTCPINTTFTGDSSLRKRPMDRVVSPLKEFGCTFSSNFDNKLPINLIGTRDAIPIRYELPIPSAQVKSAILLAGLNVRGRTTVVEREPSRDHTEKMLTAFGANLVSQRKEHLSEISVDGFPKLRPLVIKIPGDISSAAFPIAAACMIPGSNIILKGIGINPLRVGFLDTLIEMGANLRILNRRFVGGELIGDIRVIYTNDLKGIDVPESRSAKMIDEYPILAMVAATATGSTTMKGIRELRYKESDRIAAVSKGLLESGVEVMESDDQLVVSGSQRNGIRGGIQIDAANDHRIAMSFLCLGLVTKESIEVIGAHSILTSFPNFVELMNSIGAIMIMPKSEI